MSSTDLVMGAAGASGVAATYVEDVFSTYLYTGTGLNVNNTITNGIDLAAEGGLVWTKSRSAGYNNALNDTARGFSNYLISNSTGAQNSAGSLVTMTANSNGYTVNDTNGSWNESSQTFCSWTFRKQPKFFDIVTYTGTGTATAISHNLGSVPGMIIIKDTGRGTNWRIYNRGLNGGVNPEQYGIAFNTTGQTQSSGFWNDTAPTSTEFTVNTDSGVNTSGESYVAYLFAHNAGGFGASGTDNVISCGSVTASGGVLPDVNLGYEPQWLIMKNVTTGSTYWDMQDNMRGSTYGGNVQRLRANVPWAENADTTQYGFTSTGLNGASTSGFGNDTYIYMAIRRPMKVPTSGTEVFKAVKRAGTGSSTNVTAGFPVDLNITSGIEKNSEVTAPWIDRLRGSSQNFRYLWSSSTNAEAAGTASGVYELTQTGVYTYNTSYNDSTYGDNYVNWMFKRAPGFFDIVCYTGTGSATTQVHNLGVAPELIIVKLRSGGTSWPVYSANLGASNYLFLNLTSSSSTNTTIWDNTTPTASVFNIGTSSFTNSSGGTYVAYLFATCPGVSKVGSYSGTGANTTNQIDCGFTAGARFVMIKRTDATGNWYVFDTARGITSGNDPFLALNTTSAQNSSFDCITPYSAGFNINDASNVGLNETGGSYIYLAIA